MTDTINTVTDLPQVITIICSCGRKLELPVEGGQYPEFYTGQCACGLRWRLVNLTALMDSEEGYWTPPP